MDKKSKKEQIEYQKKLQSAAEKILSGNFDIKEYYGLTEAGLEAIYMAGHEMYKHKQYEKAKGIFTILTILEPASIKYLSACGSAHFMEEDYVNAAHFFRLALVNGDYTPKALLRLAECTARLEQYNLTKRYVDEIIYLSETDDFKNDNESKSYAERAKMMLGIIEAQLSKSKESSKADAEESVKNDSDINHKTSKK